MSEQSLMEMISRPLTLRPQSRLGRPQPKLGVQKKPTQKPESPKIATAEYTEEYWDDYFKSRPHSVWSHMDTFDGYTREEWEAWEAGEWEEDDKSVAPTESPIASLDIITPGNDFWVPSDEEELEEYLDSLCHGDVDSDDEEE